MNFGMSRRLQIVHPPPDCGHQMLALFFSTRAPNQPWYISCDHEVQTRQRNDGNTANSWGAVLSLYRPAVVFLCGRPDQCADALEQHRSFSTRWGRRTAFECKLISREHYARNCLAG